MRVLIINGANHYNIEYAVMLHGISVCGDTGCLLNYKKNIDEAEESLHDTGQL